MDMDNIHFQQNGAKELIDTPLDTVSSLIVQVQNLKPNIKANGNLCDVSRKEKAKTRTPQISRPKKITTKNTQPILRKCPKNQIEVKGRCIRNVIKEKKRIKSTRTPWGSYENGLNKWLCDDI